MTKRFTAFAAVVLLLLATACKKEDNSPIHNPTGYWRGSVYVKHGALLVKPGGEAALYFNVYGNDTAGAIKGYGRYTVSGNSLKAYGAISGTNDTLFYYTNMETVDLMTGIFFHTWTGEAPECKLRRQ